jgi:hypothetical protein
MNYKNSCKFNMLSKIVVEQQKLRASCELAYGITIGRDEAGGVQGAVRTSLGRERAMSWRMRAESRPEVARAHRGAGI